MSTDTESRFDSGPTRFRLGAIATWLLGVAALVGLTILVYRLSGDLAVLETLPLERQFAVGLVGVLVGLLALEGWTKYTVEFSALAVLSVALSGILASVFAVDTEEAESGREEYASGVTDSVRLGLARERAGSLAVAELDKRDPEGAVVPQLDPDVSSLIYGRTGVGKSTLIKELVEREDLSEQAIIAHALSTAAEKNELHTFFEEQGVIVRKLSSRESDVRWDPFRDYGRDLREMENVALGIFDAREVVETGWSEPARTLLVCAVTVTSAQYDDFAYLPEILKEGPEWIIEEMGKVPEGDLVASSLANLDSNDLQTIHGTVMNQLRPLLLSDVFDKELPRIGLTDYYHDPEGVLLLDNVQKDRYARGFWRFLIQTAADYSFESAGIEYFLLDEFDKLPRIGNLGELASRGRKPGSLAMLAFQDLGQLLDTYGEDTARTIWTNCPNSITFNPGDDVGAEWAVGALGEEEVRAQSVSEDGAESSATKAYRDATPVTTGEMLDLDQGEVLLNSPEGWWLCKLAK